MDRDSKLMRGDGPTIFASIKNDEGVEAVVDLILAAWRAAGAPGTGGAVGEPEED
jgi:urease accessory protein